MRRLVPRSLAGQMAILIGVALLVAQMANMALLLNEREKAGLAQTEGPAITRFVSGVADYVAADPEYRPDVIDDYTRRGARFAVRTQSTVASGVRRPGLESRLRDALQEADVAVKAVRATRVDQPPPFPPPGRQLWLDRAGREELRRGGPADGPRPERPPAAGAFGGADGPPPPIRNMRQVHFSVQLPDGQWVEGRIVTPRRDPILTARLTAATVFLYLVVLGVTIAIAAWLARPLRDLTASAEAFAGRGAPAEVQVRGPGDLRRLIVAFNAMNVRVLA